VISKGAINQRCEQHDSHDEVHKIHGAFLWSPGRLRGHVALRNVRRATLSLMSPIWVAKISSLYPEGNTAGQDLKLRKKNFGK
jgi:hypothetical protein